MRINKKEGNSLLISMFISETIICSMIVCIIPISQISALLMAFIGAMSICLNRSIPKRSVYRVALSWFLIILLFMISTLVNGYKTLINYLIYFIVFGSMGALLSINEVNIKSVSKYLTIIYALYIVIYFFSLRQKLLNSGEQYYMESMGIAYALTTIIYLSLVYYFYRDVLYLDKVIKILLYIDSLIALAIMLIDCRARGPILGVIVAFFVLLLTKVKGIKKIVIITIMGIITVVFIHNFLPIIEWLNNFLNRYNISFPALSKIIYLSTSQDGLSNSRNLFYGLAFEMIKRNIFFGHGIGYFETLGMGYVHNLLLDILLSVGVIGFIIIGGMFLFYFYRTLVYYSKVTQAYMYFLIFVGVTMLMFSSSLWFYPPFWAFFFGMINIKHINSGFRVSGK